MRCKYLHDKSREYDYHATGSSFLWQAFLFPSLGCCHSASRAICALYQAFHQHGPGTYHTMQEE